MRDLELWVLLLHFAATGRKEVNEGFLKPKKLTYIDEMLQPSPSKRATFGMWQINLGIKNTKHVLIFFQRTDKAKNFM